MNNNRLIVTILVLILVLVGLGWFLSANDMLPGANNSDKDSSPSDWHAVFLTNGQVYFGKMDSAKGQYVKLEDIYYIQVQQQQEGQNQQNNQQAQISLVKLGNELHGPVDEMSINRDHILFYEEMKNDAQVVKAIEEYKKNGPQPAPSASAQPTPTSTK